MQRTKYIKFVPTTRPAPSDCIQEMWECYILPVTSNESVTEQTKEGYVVVNNLPRSTAAYFHIISEWKNYTCPKGILVVFGQTCTEWPELGVGQTELTITMDFQHRHTHLT